MTNAGGEQDPGETAEALREMEESATQALGAIKQVQLEIKAEREAEREALNLRLKFREQRIALMGVLATAVLGIVGSVVAWNVADNQMANQSLQSAQAFTREQQLAAYADYLTAIDKFAAAQTALNKELSKCKENIPVSALPGYDAAESAFRDIRVKRNVIAIVGSDETINVTNSYAFQLSELRGFADTYCGALRDGSEQGDEVLLAAVRTFDDKIELIQAMFATQGRKDVEPGSADAEGDGG